MPWQLANYTKPLTAIPWFKTFTVKLVQSNMRNTMGKVEVILSDAMSLLIGGRRKRCQTLKFID